MSEKIDCFFHVRRAGYQSQETGNVTNRFLHRPETRAIGLTFRMKQGMLPVNASGLPWQQDFTYELIIPFHPAVSSKGADNQWFG